MGLRGGAGIPDWVAALVPTSYDSTTAWMFGVTKIFMAQLLKMMGLPLPSFLGSPFFLKICAHARSHSLALLFAFSCPLFPTRSFARSLSLSLSLSFPRSLTLSLALSLASSFSLTDVCVSCVRVCVVAWVRVWVLGCVRMCVCTRMGTWGAAGKANGAVDLVAVPALLMPPAVKIV